MLLNVCTSFTLVDQGIVCSILQTHLILLVEAMFLLVCLASLPGVPKRKKRLARTIFSTNITADGIIIWGRVTHEGGEEKGVGAESL